MNVSKTFGCLFVLFLCVCFHMYFERAESYDTTLMLVGMVGWDKQIHINYMLKLNHL